MKSVAIFVATVAVVRGLPQVPEDKEMNGGNRFPETYLAPPRGPPLAKDHVVNTSKHLNSVVKSACFQDSTGQYKDPSSPEGSDAPRIKYPCISEQEIAAYCSDKYAHKPAEMANCLFGRDSSYREDHVCCIKCRVQNGDGREGTVDQAVKFVDELQKKYDEYKAKDGAQLPPMMELGDMVKREQKIVPFYPKNTTPINSKGVASINILDYCPNLANIKQQAASPLPTDKAASPVPFDKVLPAAPKSPTSKAASPVPTDKAASPVPFDKVLPAAPKSPECKPTSVKLFAHSKFAYQLAEQNAYASVVADTSFIMSICANSAAPPPANHSVDYFKDRVQMSLQNTQLLSYDSVLDPKTVQVMTLPDNVKEETTIVSHLSKMAISLLPTACGCLLNPPKKPADVSLEGSKSIHFEADASALASVSSSGGQPMPGVASPGLSGQATAKANVNGNTHKVNVDVDASGSAHANSGVSASADEDLPWCDAM